MIHVLRNKYTYTLLMFFIAVFVSDRMVRNEFNLFNFNIYTMLLGLCLEIIVLVFSKKFCGNLQWRTASISSIIIICMFFLSNPIASRLNEYNKYTITKISLPFNDNSILLFYGIFPTILDFGLSTEIKVKGLNGSMYIYSIENKEWKIDG
ncbi:MAG: hypothetical protein IPN36_17900 [Bacteroidetes bacterium]|nr:hypothetical protein [Bacteroidota bacterium]